MKKLSLLIPIIILTAVLISCKDNPYTPSGPPEPVTLFSQDSIAVQTSDTGTMGLVQEAYYPITDTLITSLNLKFALQTNAVDNGDRIYYKVELAKTGVSYFAQYEYVTRSIDSSYDYTFDISSYKKLNAKFTVAIYKKMDFSLKYLRIKDMKVIKIY
jgi:hypothetical protein